MTCELSYGSTEPVPVLYASDIRGDYDQRDYGILYSLHEPVGLEIHDLRLVLRDVLLDARMGPSVDPGAVQSDEAVGR